VEAIAIVLDMKMIELFTVIKMIVRKGIIIWKEYALIAVKVLLDVKHAM
jgi:hypothetical protein